MSGDVLCCHNWSGRCCWIRWAEAKDVAKHPTRLRVTPRTKNYADQNVKQCWGWETYLDYSARLWVYLVLHCQTNIPKPLNLSIIAELQYLLIAWKIKSLLLILVFRSWGILHAYKSIPQREFCFSKLSLAPSSTPPSFYRSSLQNTHLVGSSLHVSYPNLLILWNAHVLHMPLPLSQSVPLPFVFPMRSHALHCYIAIPFTLSSQ